MKKFFAITLAVMMMCLCFTGCRRAYDVPEFVTIEPHQTAFLIPLIGDTGNQASFESEEMLMEAKVAAKEIQIPHRWVQTGRKHWQGEYRPTMSLIVVDRSPVTREWSESAATGTSSANQAISAESKESIMFSAGMNCSAQIYSESDAVKFLYSYNNTPLSTIMDSEIRTMVESKFVEECAKRTMNEILVSKAEIMDNVRNTVTDYFKDKGITITVLGMKDGLEYADTAIQKSINDKFSSEMKLTTQENENKRIISEAQAKAEAELIRAKAEAEANKELSASINQTLVEMEKAKKWDGKLPTVSGGATPIIDFSNNK